MVMNYVVFLTRDMTSDLSEKSDLLLESLKHDPPENIKNSGILWCFQGDQKGTSGRKWLNNNFIK